MKKSVLLLSLVIVLFLTGISSAKLVLEEWCFKCPYGGVLTLGESDRYYCIEPGTNRSLSVPLWAKAVWSKRTGQECLRGYTPYGTDFCYKCPPNYALRSAFTDYRDQLRDIIGSWVGCDGRVVTFTYEGGEYVGRYTNLGGLGPWHFKIGEVGYRVKKSGSTGEYVGQVKWRWTSGKYQWKSNTITINGDYYSDTGSDGCSRNMSRIKR